MSIPFTPRVGIRFLTVLAFMGIAVSCCQLAVSQDAKQLIRVKDASGKDTALLEKVVVVSGKATLAQTASDPGEPIEPWAIFFRLRNDDGTTGPVSGKLRVGDSSGTPGVGSLRKT